MKHSIISLMLLLAASTVRAQSMGTLTENGTSLEISSAVAVLGKGPSLTFYLLPFTPTADETARLQANEALFLLGKPSPDAKKWPTCPWGRVKLDWGFEPGSVGDPKKASVYVYSFGVGAENSNLSTTKDGKDVAVSLIGSVKEGQEVTLTTKGSDTFTSATLGWDLRVKARIVPSKQ